MNRRQLTRAIAFAPLSCLVGELAIAQAQPSAKPVENTRPFRKTTVPEDGRRVIVFFDFACPFCALYYGALLNFSGTVPPQIQTMFVPVVNMADLARRNEQMIAAKCFYAALQISTKVQMARFSTSIFESYSEVHNLSSKNIWIKAAKVAGIDLSKFSVALKSGSSDFQIKYAVRKTLQYALTATPSVAVGGRYVITPDDAGGDQAMFFQILNGLTSEIL